MEENEFARQSREAVEKMREMNSRANTGRKGQNMPPVPPFVRLQGNRQNTTSQNQRQNTQPKETAVPDNKPEATKRDNQGSGFLSGLNIPFLDMFSKDTDVSLIIGLLLILMSEKADKRLLFALVYILM